jgi:putrescine aminotransferase
LLEHVRAVTPHFQTRLRDLTRYEIVGEARGVGLIGCIEGAAAPGMPEKSRLAIDTEFGARVDAKCDEMGLIVRPLINMCVFSPPLIISEAQIDAMFDILDTAVGQVQQEML